MAVLFFTFMSLLSRVYGWDAMLKATNVNDLISAEVRLEKEQKDKEACGFEQQQGLFPVSCHKLLQRSLTHVEQGKVSHELSLTVERMCKAHYARVVDKKVLHSLLKLNFSPTCLMLLKEHLNDLNYANSP